MYCGHSITRNVAENFPEWVDMKCLLCVRLVGLQRVVGSLEEGVGLCFGLWGLVG